MRYALAVALLCLLPGCYDDSLEMFSDLCGGAGERTHEADRKSSMPERWAGEAKDEVWRQQQENDRTRERNGLNTWRDIVDAEAMPEWKVLADRNMYDAHLKVFRDRDGNDYYRLNFYCPRFKKYRDGSGYYGETIWVQSKSAKSCVYAAYEWLDDREDKKP